MMDHGAISAQRQPPQAALQAVQCSASKSDVSFKCCGISKPPFFVKTASGRASGGFFSKARSGPILRRSHQSAPRLSRSAHAESRNRVDPAEMSSFISAPAYRARTAGRSFEETLTGCFFISRDCNSKKHWPNLRLKTPGGSFLGCGMNAPGYAIEGVIVCRFWRVGAG